VARVIPSQALFAAPTGSVRFGDKAPGVEGISLQPSDGSATLQVLAAQDVRLGSLTLAAITVPAGIALQGESDAGAVDPMAATPANTAASPPALRVVAQHGDLVLAGPLQSARPVRLLAGQDLRLAAPSGGLLVVHPSDSAAGVAASLPAPALSTLQAGRDIAVDSQQQLPFGTLVLRGGGDLVLLAGRHLELGNSYGVVSRGNLDDSLGLAAGGANLLAVTGSSAALGDVSQATARGFVLLGGGGVASHAADLAAWLAAEASGAASPGLGSAAATAFAALSAGAQLDQARALLGSPRYDTALLAALQALQGQRSLLDAGAARTAFEALAAVDQARVVGSVLATGFDALPSARAQALLLALAVRAPSGYAQRLSNFVAQRSGSLPLGLDGALTGFSALPVEQQLLLTAKVLGDELRAAGRAAVATSGSERAQAYTRGYAAMAAVFPGVRPAGNIDMTTSQIKTQQGGDITLLTPGGGINAGALASAGTLQPNSQGIVTVAGGNITAALRNDFAVNQSRVFTLAQGDVLLWSSEGDLDAGRGAKTVRGAPKPVYGLDANGRVTVDTSGSFTGSGIAVLDAGSALDLFAPKGEINAGEAGIKSAGSATLGADRFAGLDNLKFSGPTAGVPPPAPSVGATAGLAAAAQTANANTPRDAASSDDDDERRKKKTRRKLLLDFLGFGQGD
jgi:hypothetical protein